MVQLQIVFNRIAENKKKIKDLRQVYQDALASSANYKEVVDKIKALREKKKQIEETTKQQFASEFNQLDALKTDIESDMVLLSDAALSSLMKGETVEVQDEYHNVYDPVFNVKFKRAN